MSLKYISVNIEGHRHFEERLLPFLLREQADVISLQEVFEVDMPILQEKLGMTGHFYPLAIITETNIHQSHALGRWGIAQLSKLSIQEKGAEYYQGDIGTIPEFRSDTNPNGINRALAWMTVNHDSQDYIFATTHFIWTPNGDPSELQHQKLAEVWKILEKLPDYVLSGDFNAPRGLAIFDGLASRLKDNIPPEVTTSIDGTLHKAGNLQLMVDGLFSTPEYLVSNVKVESGVSDHKALVAEITKL